MKSKLSKKLFWVGLILIIPFLGKIGYHFYKESQYQYAKVTLYFKEEGKLPLTDTFILKENKLFQDERCDLYREHHIGGGVISIRLMDWLKEMSLGRGMKVYDICLKPYKAYLTKKGKEFRVEEVSHYEIIKEKESN